MEKHDFPFASKEKRLAAVREGGDKPHAFVPGGGVTGPLKHPLCKVCGGRRPYVAHDEDLR